MPFPSSSSSSFGAGTTPVPPEPPPAPRPFHWRALDAATVFLMLFGGIWAFVGVTITIVFTVAGGPLWNDLILSHRAKTAEAMPTSVDGTGSSVNGRRVFRVSYDFFDERGQPREGSADTTDPILLARAERRERLSIDYDPLSPQRSRLTGGSASFFGWFTLMPLAFAVVGLLVLRAGLARLFRTRNIYVHGTTALARVTGISSSNMRVNRRPVQRVEYEFDAMIARTMGRATGSTTALDPPAVGSPIWVIYRSSNPTQSVVAR
jgi:hypothetical protein